MAKLSHSHFNENAARGVFVTRDITDELVGELSPRIIALRQDGTQPICLYIDSAGGSVFYARRLLSLMSSPRQDGHVPKIVSICIGFAASAAADLLALGDYALAYPFSTIHHHGTRQTEKAITVESIEKIESSLRQTNEDFAIRLATKIFHRLIVRILQIRREAAPNFLFHETIADPQTFISAIRDKLSEKHRHLVDDATQKQADVSAILQLADVSPDKLEKPPESQILKAVVDFEVNKSGSNSKELLTSTELGSIRDNFYQIRALFHPRYWTNLVDIVERKGVFFLQPEEKTEFEKMPPSKHEERIDFLMEKVVHKLNPIWWFVVSLSRSLQTGEHTLKPVDAYWLGLVDEVIGSDLPCLREMMMQAEKARQTLKAAASKQKPS